MLILWVGQIRHNHLNTLKIQIPEKDWQYVTYEQGGESLKWERLAHGAWVLQLPDQDIAVGVNDKVFLGVLSAFLSPIDLELVSHWLWDDVALERYGLSENMKTTITLKTKIDEHVISIGHRTPSGQEIYVLEKGKVYKGNLAFIFELEQSLRNLR
ncbi:MAG: hypothetical protein ACRCVN_04915 [Spirochaetia bacterium]